MYTVVVVDDEVPAIQCMEEILRGYAAFSLRVIASQSGEDALAKLKNVAPDILLVDIEMQGMDGFALIDRVHARHNAAAKAIMVTAYSQFEYTKKAIDIRAFDYILKPVKEHELYQALVEAHEGHAEPGRKLKQMLDTIERQRPEKQFRLLQLELSHIEFAIIGSVRVRKRKCDCFMGGGTGGKRYIQSQNGQVIRIPSTNPPCHRIYRHPLCGKSSAAFRGRDGVRSPCVFLRNFQKDNRGHLRGVHDQIADGESQKLAGRQPAEYYRSRRQGRV